MSFSSIKLFFDVIITIMLMCFLANKHEFSTSHECCIFLSSIAIPLFAYHFFLLIKRKQAFFRFETYFVILIYLFFYGRIILRALNLDQHIFWDLFRRFTETGNIYIAGVQALLYVHLIFLVFTTNVKKISIPPKTPMFIPEHYLRTVATTMTIITLPCKLYVDFAQIMAQQIAHGYVSIIKVNGVIFCIANLFPVAIMFCLAALKKNKKKGKLLICSFIGYSIMVMTLSGDRRYATIAILIMVLFFIKLYRIHISKEQILTTSFFLLLGLNFLAAIRNIRSSTGSFSSLADEMIRQLFENNIIYETFAEFGVSFFTLVVAVKYYGSALPFFHGSTLLASFLSTIPGIGVFLNKYIFAQSPAWVAVELHNQPLGASFFMDAYANFGLYGSIIFVFTFSILLKKILFFKTDLNSFELVRYYSLCYVLLNLVRASMLEITRMSVYCVVIPYILFLICKWVKK